MKRHISTSATIPDVICIQETFLHDKLRFAMENYNVERLNRPARARGGIATLMRTGIRTAWENEDTGAFYRHLQPDVS